MYSASNIAVDKGLGFDFSAIGDLVRTALPVGLNIFSQQMQLKQVKKMSQSGYMQQPTMFGQSYGQLPTAQALQNYPTFGGQYAQPSSGMSGTTMILIGGGVLVAGLIAFKAFK